mmetsp:Transcript_25074/g.63775  ORF Transcript_25074/g.63775 Transcript_25074/m.63775 type:complete len:267 (-) Transcript_25074:18-818(-)
MKARFTNNQQHIPATFCGMASDGTEQTLHRTAWYRTRTIKGTMRHRIERHGTNSPQNGLARSGAARHAQFIPQNLSEASEAGPGELLLNGLVLAPLLETAQMFSELLLVLVHVGKAIVRECDGLLGVRFSRATGRDRVKRARAADNLLAVLALRIARAPEDPRGRAQLGAEAGQGLVVALSLLLLGGVRLGLHAHQGLRLLLHQVCERADLSPHPRVLSTELFLFLVATALHEAEATTHGEERQVTMGPQAGGDLWSVPAKHTART